MSEPRASKWTKKEVAERWKFPWSVMKVLLGGKSAVDLSSLGLKSEQDARAFLKSYGFDPDTAQDQRKMHGVLVEALYFIETFLMPREWAQGQQPPAEVLACDNPVQLLAWAGDKAPEARRRRVWACALLKVMHTITHMDDPKRFSNIQEARQQIIRRFHKALFRDAKGGLRFGDKEQSILLEKVEWKFEKPRNSIILKLLHKPGNVAENIYDLLGLRLVTKNLSETLIAVKFLRQFYLVDFPNTLPARARNTLIDVEQFQMQLKALRPKLFSGEISPEEFEHLLINQPVTKRRGRAINPHSAVSYRAIQLTCRQRIRYPNPLLAWQQKVKTYLASGEAGPADSPFFVSLLDFIARWQRSEDAAEIAVFFPFEVQILDKEAASSVEQGEASHDRYKRSQVRTARRRILYDILTLRPS